MEILALANKIVKGFELNYLFENLSYTNLIFSNKVIYGASESLQRIQNFYGVSPSLDGKNIDDFIIIRDILYNATENKKLLNGLVIIAPHTHWREIKPVIYKYDPSKEAYIIGNHVIDVNKEYIPVTFVFNNGFPLAYEWAESSIPINQIEWKLCHNLICSLNEKLIGTDIPLGIAIDFRFRDSLLNVPESSLEIPIENESSTYKGFSYIINNTVRNEEDESEQVSWHAISELVYNFTESETLILNELRYELNLMQDPIARENRLKELKQALR